MNYQIKTIDGALWIVPNAAPYPLAQDISIRIAYINGPKLLPGNPQHDISGTIKLQWQPITEPMMALITVPANIIMDTDRSRLKDAWKQFVAALDQQADESFQYMIPEGPALVLAELGQNMPLPQQEVKYYQLHLGFDDRPYIDLQAGMRLKLAFANYYNEAHSGSGQQLKGFAGTGASYAYVQSGHNGNYLCFNSYMDLQRVSVTVAKDLVEKGMGLIANVIDLAAANKYQHYRLLYPSGEFVTADKPGLDLQDSVCLAGAALYKDLPDLTEPLLPDAHNYHVSLFNGRCVVTPEILIRLNGKPVYVPVGSVLKNLLEKESITGISSNKLTFLRYYNSQKSKLTFEGTTVATELYLLPGDDIAWVPTANFSLNERVKAIYRIKQTNVNAVDLTHLTLISFGRDGDVVLPFANDMGVALVSLNNPLYDSVQIAEGLYRNYNDSGYFINPYTGDELAYSLYFAGFDIIAIARGLVAEVVPPIEIATGDSLVYFLLQSGIGYNVREIGNAIYKTLYKHEREDAWYMVKALMIGAANYKLPYAPQKVAEGIYYAVEYVVENAFELATALIMGAHAVNPDKYYSVDDIARLLYLTYQSDGKILTELQLAYALANACKGQPLGYSVSQVAEGVAAVYLDITAETMALALKNCGGGYVIADVAVGIYSIIYVPSADKISVHELTRVLYKAYNSQQNLNIDMAKAVAFAIQGVTTDVLARALADVFVYKADNEQQVIDLVEAIDAVYKFDATNKDVLVRLATSLKGAITFNTKEQKHGQYFSKALRILKNGQVEIINNAWAVREALAYNGDDQGDVTCLIGSLFYAYQADVYTLASTTVVSCWYINNRRDQMLHLATGLRDALGYSKDSLEKAELIARVLISVLPGISGADVMWTIGEVFDCNSTTADQVHINFLARITKVVYDIDLSDKERVEWLSKELVEKFGLIKESKYTEESVGLIAKALIFAFVYKGRVDSHVTLVASAVFESFPGLTPEAIGSVLFTAFKYESSPSDESEIKYLAKAVKTCGYVYDANTIVLDIAKIIVDVFSLNISQHPTKEVEIVTLSLKYAFSFDLDNAEGAGRVIKSILLLWESLDNATVFNKVTSLFQITISQSDDGARDNNNQWKFRALIMGGDRGRKIVQADDATIIEVTQLGIAYFNLNHQKSGALGLIACCFAGELKITEPNQGNFNRCLKLVVASFKLLQPEPWLYIYLEELGRGIKIAYIDMYISELVKAFKYALPGLLPSYMGVTVMKTLNLETTAANLDTIGTVIADSFDFKAFGEAEKLAFGLLFDHCGWKADKLDEKLTWCKKYFKNWQRDDETFIRLPSEDKVCQASNSLLFQNQSPLEMAIKLKEKFPEEQMLPILIGLLIYPDYYYLHPAEGVKPIAGALKKIGAPKDYCFLVLIAEYQNQWNDQYVALVNQIYDQPTDVTNDITTEIEKTKKGIGEIIKEIYYADKEPRA